MDACSFPELLALDLETAGPIFAAKRMTAGAPRPSTPRAHSNLGNQKNSGKATHASQWPRTFAFTPTQSQSAEPIALLEWESATLRDEDLLRPRPVSPFSCEDAISPLPATGTGPSGAATHPVVIMGESDNYSPFSPFYPSITNHGDNASINSFEIPNISLVSPRCASSEQQYHSQQYPRHQLPRDCDSDSDSSNTDDSSFHDLVMTTTADNRRKSDAGDGAVGTTGDSFNMVSDASSMSSFDFTSSSHGRRHSIGTAATSVASASHSSAKSHTLSAIGPAASEPTSSTERHVSFTLNGQAVDVCSQSSEHRPPDAMTSSSTSIAEHRDSGRVSRITPQRSWMDFGEDESDGETPSGAEQGQPTDQVGVSRSSSVVSRISRPHSPSPLRPNSAMSWLGKDKDQNSALHDWTERKRMSQVSAPSIRSLRRRSSLGSYQRSMSDKATVLLPTQYQPAERPHARPPRPSNLWKSRLSVSSDASVPLSTREVERMCALMRMQSTAGFEEPALPSREVDEDEEEEGDHLIGDCDEDDFNQEEDEIMMATVMPLSKPMPGSVSTREGSLDGGFSAHSFPYAYSAQETSRGLQSWLQHTSETHQVTTSQLLRCQDGVFRFQGQTNAPGEQVVVRQTRLQDRHNGQPVVPLFFQPSDPMVAIRLPKEVIDMLRVSVSCFPSTMLSLSSFCIQTIRSYSRKVRRLSEFDSDIALSPKPFNNLPPSPTSPRRSVSATSTHSAHGGLGQDCTSRMESSAAPSHKSSRRFWKRLIAPRSNSSLSESENRLHNKSARGAEDAADVSQDRIGGTCFKRIFPSGSDYICDALYAHILAFNYISMLCSQASTAVPAPLQSPDTRHVEASTAGLETQTYQTIRVYAAEDVHLLPASRLLSPAPAPKRRGVVSDSNADIPSPPETPPPSRGGHAEEDARLISRKAAILLGIQDHLEPDTVRRKSETAVGVSGMGGVSSLGRRYNSLRRRRRKASRDEADKAEKAGKPRTVVKKTPPAPLLATSLFEGMKSTPIEDWEQAKNIPLTPPLSAAAVAAAVASEAAMRDLLAGLYGCIRHLVSMLKQTASQLDDDMLLSTEVQEVDQVFLRTLCELVRSQEEQV